MSTKANDDAFPRTYSDRDGDVCSTVGMTKREYFAALALQGLLACPSGAGAASDNAASAVESADALIQELNK